MSKPQRRKGNAKTASSAQAAELLGSGGFVGFDIGISNVFETVDNEFVDLGNDVTILLKKLSKKDPQTREKGLRELIDVVSLKSDEELELIFPYYATALPKLSLDGSPTVRQLSLKCLSFFIGRLKRAAEKHLKKLIPFVLIGSCDTSAVVCGQANELLKSCFPDGKSERVVKLFAEETCIICCNLIARKHNLFAPQKYDDEETATQRECRLTTECLNLLSRLVERHPEIADTVLDIFNNVTQLKKLLAGNSSPLVQAGLLNLAQKLPTTYKLAESTVSHYAVSNLDNADATIGVASFNILHQLLSAHKDAFFAKFDVKKTLIPRLLTIVRKKAIHWRYCGPFLLPSFAAIFDQLSSEDQTVFGLSFLISFADNMPFIVASIPPSSWSSAFGECFKLFLTRVTDPSKLAEQLIPIFLKMIEKADLASEEVQNDFVSLIRWICEKKDSLLAAPHLNSLINTLELNLMNRRPQTDTFMAKIFTMALEDCATFHSDALRKSDCPTSFVTALEDSGDDYFAKISKNIDITNLVNSKERNLSRAELDSLAVIVLRILNLADSNENSTDFRQDLALAVLKLQNSVWNRLDLQTLLRKLGLDVKDTQVFLTLMKIDNGHLDLLVHILTSCQESVQAEIVSSILESGDGQNVTFILKAMNAITMNSRTRKDVSLWLWEQFFDADSDENLEELVQAIQTKEWQPERSMIAEYLPHLFSNMPTSYSFTKNSTLNHSFLLERIKVLCKVSPTMLDSFLVSSDFFSFTVKNIDHQFAGREIISLTPFIRQPEVGSSSRDRDILETVGQLSRCASLFMDILDERGRCDAQTLAYLQLVHGAVIILKKTQFYQNRYLDVEKTIEKHLVKNSEQTSQTIPLLLEHPTSSIAHYALSNLQRLLPDAIEQLPEDVPLSTLWATRRDCSKIKMNTSERFLTRFFCENTPREFIDQLQQFCGQEGSSWQEDNQLFSVKAKETMSQLNIVTLQAAVDVFEKSYTSLTAELIDFVMCGLVATFETMDEIYTNEESVSLEQDAQFGNAMLLYRTCCDLYRTHGAVVFADWKDFYYPFTTRIIVRIWMRNSFATSSLAARELAVAVNNLAEIPADLSLPGKPRSQLDGYDSETLLLAERCLQGLRADSYLDNFSSMKLLNILATRLYRLENGDWAEEEEITKKGPKSLQVSRVLLSILQDKTPRGFIRFGCFRAALEPLKSDDLTEEEKLKYCEAFPSLIDAVVPVLLQAGQDRPAEEIITNDFQGRMAGSVCDYLLNIVYEICALVPAVFRAWYNGLPKAASSIVNKFITDSISRQIITNEFNRVKEQNRSREKTDLLKIRVFPVLRQIMAEYTVEETQMVLTISMPENYPLGLPELDLEKAIVSNARAKKWLLQLTSYLFFQNGSIVQGIIQWKRNVDRDVEGAESCTICLTIVHQNSHQLPKVKCRQCHNKFHSNCLYKWFESSHNTQCPLCRTSFT